METTCLKLGVKRKMLKNNFRFFIVGALPFFTISLLIFIDYYFINQIKKVDFAFTSVIEPYNETIRLSIIVFMIFLSFCLWKGISLCSQSYFIQRSTGKRVPFFRVVKGVSFSQYNSYLGMTIIKSLLTVAFIALYFLPCLAISGLLIYCYRYERYGFNVNITLFISSIILFAVGSVFLFITLKRYSFCTYVLVMERERNPLKVITRSIEIMENRCVEYSLYCVSFLGWFLSCVFIIPVVYAVPYFNLSKWSYVYFVEKKDNMVTESEKPIIFYIQKRVEN